MRRTLKASSESTVINDYNENVTTPFSSKVESVSLSGEGLLSPCESCISSSSVTVSCIVNFT